MEQTTRQALGIKLGLSANAASQQSEQSLANTGGVGNLGRVNSNSLTSQDGVEVSRLLTDWSSMQDKDIVAAAGGSTAVKSDVANQKNEPDEGTKAEEVNSAEPDSQHEVYELYSAGKTTCQCCITWTDHNPFSDRDKDENSADAKKRREDSHAIVRRREAHGGESELKTHSIQINSAPIKALLGNIFADDLSIDASAPKLTFKPPFASLVHRWDQVLSAVEEEVNEKSQSSLSILSDILGPEIQESLDALKHLDKTGCIPYDQVVLAFIPGEVILHTSKSGEIEAGILRNVDIEKSIFDPENTQCIFTADTIDWDGERFGYRNVSWALNKYPDGRRLADLSVFPLRAHPRRYEIERELIDRGKRFEELRGMHFMSYNGSATFEESDTHPLFGQFEKHRLRPVNDRVIIDATSFYRLQNDVHPTLKSLDAHNAGAPNNHEQAYDTPELASLTDRQYLLTAARVKGFALQAKAWCEFDVKHLAPISWNDCAFRNLVLPERQKNMLHAMIDPGECINDMSFDDFITGKGKGTIILLHGPPGVGKSFTAEAVAEQIHRPLYRLSAAELGTKVSSVEPKLQEALTRASAWDAVLLIDEADVFLERRSSNSLEQNELVTIFLRLLEFYNGIMVLTTNRISAIDDAFESRLDVVLTYNNLDEIARRQVWKNFLGSMRHGMSHLGKSDINALAKHDLNGRQIKSAIKTGICLAAKEKTSLRFHHLEEVIKLRQEARMVFQQGPLRTTSEMTNGYIQAAESKAI